MNDCASLARDARTHEALGRNALRRLRAALFDRQDGRCAYCDEPMTRLLGPRLCTLDHIIPLRAGGTWHPKNLVAACHQCNRLKGCLTLDQIRRLLSRIERLTAHACVTHYENGSRPPEGEGSRWPCCHTGADAGNNGSTEARITSIPLDAQARSRDTKTADAEKRNGLLYE